MRIKKKKGFTLIELIVVIAILGILAAIAIPSYVSMQDTSKVKSDAATALQIVNAARVQETDTGIAVTPGVDASKVVSATYMSVPTAAQSGGPFAISGAGGTASYVVTFTPTSGAHKTKVQTVTEGGIYAIN